MKRVPEYLREFVDKKKSLPVVDDIEEIAQGQIRSIAALTRKAQRVLFCDTCLMMTVIYSDYYLGDCPPLVRRAAEEEFYHLTLFTQDDIPWSPEPMQRDGPEARSIIQNRIKKALIRRKINFLTLNGTRVERLNLSIEAIDAILR